MLHRVTRPWRRARIEAGGSVTPALSASPDQWKRRRTEEKAPVARPVCLGERNGSRVRYAGCAALDPFLSPRPRKSVGDGRKRGSAKKAEELSPRDLTTGAHIEARALMPGRAGVGILARRGAAQHLICVKISPGLSSPSLFHRIRDLAGSAFGFDRLAYFSIDHPRRTILSFAVL